MATENKKNSNDTAQGVTLNGNQIIGIGMRPVTRQGMDARITYALAVMVRTVGRTSEWTELKILADCLKGSRAIEETLDRFTGKTYTRERALLLCEEFAKQFGVDILRREAEELKEYRARLAAAEEAAKAEEKSEEDGEKGEKGEKAARPKKTLTEKLAAVLNKAEGPLVKCEALVQCLAVYNPAAAAAARSVLAGEAVKEAEKLAAKAKADAEEARRAAERAAKK